MGLKITFVGSGNIAWNLAHALDKNGHTIIQVISRSEEHAKALATKFGAFYGTEFSELYGDSDLVIMSISDDSYADAVQQLTLKPGTVICHTSGPIPMDVLGAASEEYGVFYPLQSFNKERLKDFKEVPILIEAVDSKVERTLINLAESLSNMVRIVSSEDRKKYHLSAVFANNFTNLMYVCSEMYLKQERLDFELLKPLIYDTALRIRNEAPHDVQTGPAKRKDLKVLEGHQQMIKDPILRDIYDQLSKLIMTLS